MVKPVQRWAAAAAAGITFAAAGIGSAAAGTANASANADANANASANAVSPAHVAVLSGGVSVDEFAALNRQAEDYQLKLILAAKHSGAYLADVDVVVRALPSRAVVLEHRSAGPLVLAELAPGRYEVTASYGQVLPGAPTTNTRVITVPDAQSLAQMVLYFDTGDDLSPDSPPAFSSH